VKILQANGTSEESSSLYEFAYDPSVTLEDLVQQCSSYMTPKMADNKDNLEILYNGET
jgi:hypothetical protein